MRLAPFLLAAVALASACGREPRRPPVAEPQPAKVPAIPAVAQPVLPLAPLAPAGELVLLSPEEHLLRIALVLRGGRPSDDELAAVRADPGAL